MLLKRSELEQGKVYQCVLSDRRVLIFDIRDTETDDKKKSLVCRGRYFNSVTGLFEVDSFVDDQLFAIDEVYIGSSINGD